MNRNLNICICDSTEDATIIYNKLLENGFNDVMVFDCPDRLMYAIENNIAALLPDIIISDAHFKNNPNTKNLEALSLFKDICEDCIIICMSNQTFLDNSSSSVTALKYGCDAWVNRKDKDYVEDLLNKVNHWAEYIEEREKLNLLYTNILSSNSLLV